MTDSTSKKGYTQYLPVPTPEELAALEKEPPASDWLLDLTELGDAIDHPEVNLADLDALFEKVTTLNEASPPPPDWEHDPEDAQRIADIVQFPCLGPGAINNRYGPQWIIRCFVEIAERNMQVRPVYKKRGNGRTPTGEYAGNDAVAIRALNHLAKIEGMYVKKLEVENRITDLSDQSLNKRIKGILAAHPGLREELFDADVIDADFEESLSSLPAKPAAPGLAACDTLTAKPAGTDFEPANSSETNPEPAVPPPDLTAAVTARLRALDDDD